MMRGTAAPTYSFSIDFTTFLVLGFLLTIWNAESALGDKESKTLRHLFQKRMKRATNCDREFIIKEMTSNTMLPVLYTAAQLDTCLNNSVLMTNLTELGHIAFNSNQLLILKKKLGEIYTSGLPEEQIRQLGFIITVYGPDEISMWNITNVDTLAFVLRNSPNLDTTKVVVRNYVQGSGPLNAVALDAIGGPLLCTLHEKNLMTIQPTELKKARPLNIFTCTQAKKDILFGIAKVAFQDFAGDLKAYFNQLKPYIGGARASDLQRLAPGDISMDFQTFSSLNPVEVEKLTAQNIQDLLVTNLNSLKVNEDHEIVQRWVNSHKVTEVMNLGIGLRGGISPAGLGNFSFRELMTGSASLKSCSHLLSFGITVIGITLQSSL